MKTITYPKDFDERMDLTQRLINDDPNFDADKLFELAKFIDHWNIRANIGMHINCPETLKLQLIMDKDSRVGHLIKQHVAKGIKCFQYGFGYDRHASCSLCDNCNSIRNDCGCAVFVDYIAASSNEDSDLGTFCGNCIDRYPESILAMVNREWNRNIKKEDVEW